MLVENHQCFEVGIMNINGKQGIDLSFNVFALICSLPSTLLGSDAVSRSVSDKEERYDVITPSLFYLWSSKDLKLIQIAVNGTPRL